MCILPPKLPSSLRYGRSDAHTSCEDRCLLQSGKLTTFMDRYIADVGWTSEGHNRSSPHKQAFITAGLTHDTFRVLRSVDTPSSACSSHTQCVRSIVGSAIHTYRQHTTWPSADRVSCEPCEDALSVEYSRQPKGFILMNKLNARIETLSRT